MERAATSSSPEGSKVMAASSLKKQDGNAFGKSCIGKGMILLGGRGGGGFQNKGVIVSP